MKMLIKSASVLRVKKIIYCLHSAKLCQSSVDNAEIEKFKTMAAEMWDTQGQARALHSLNKLRLHLIKGELQSGIHGRKCEDNGSPFSGLNFLDVGCGVGILSERLAKMGAVTVGIDPCHDMIEAAKVHASLDTSLINLQYLCTNVEEHLASKQSFYDVIVASEVIEHTKDPKLFVKSCCSGLKPGGSIFLTTLNRTAAAWIGSIIFAERILKIVPKNTHDWEKYIKPEELRLMLQDNGCEVQLVQGMYYNFISNKWYFTPYKGINFAIHAKKHCE